MKSSIFVPLCALAAQTLLAQAPISYSASADLDRVIEEAIKEDRIPGAVALIGQPGKILHFKAYGYRALVPQKEEMTLDTIFDAASLTKVVATTSSIMKLFDEGRIRLNDKVTVYLPGFQGGKSDITIRQLLTHFSGLRPDLTLTPEWSGYETGISKALVDKPVAEPGERMIYSDINFELLGEIVHKVSGVPLDEYARREIFLPLGMKESMFNPPAAWKPRIAPTEMWKGSVLRGVVHDPTCRFMGGVAGHAGLFTTAMDLSRFATFMLNLGQMEGSRIVSPLTVRKFTEPQTPPLQTTMRGLGWDIDSPFSGNRGELFPIGSYGHTGFTGTSIWMDPYTKTYVILLTNSVHPHLRPATTALRAKIATIAAAAAGIDVQSVTLTGFNELLPARAVGRTAETLAGIDVLVQERFSRLAGKRVGLITNHTGLTRTGERNIDAMLAAGVKLTALFSPEHGISGKEDQENVANAKDDKTGLPIYSLYKGEDRTPGASVLKGVEVLVFDIQDIGTRFYTYPSTMRNAMKAAAVAGIPILILDRPNPITGLHVEGPVLEEDKISFVGCATLPLRHGMTIGELARYLNEEDKIHARLEVVKLKNWRRADWFDATTLGWVDPSPNMRSLNAALLYPGIGMLEYAKNYSVGRGTDAPFEQVGADWINGPQLAAYLNHRMVPGVRFYPTRFTPTASNLKGKVVQGVRFVIIDREGFSSLRLGLELAVALQKLYPGKIDVKLNRNLIGSNETIEAIERAEDPRNVEPKLQEELQPFLEKRAKYLLYQ